MKPFWKDQRGETNLVSILVIMVIIVVLTLLFMPYIRSAAQYLLQLLGIG